MSNSGLKHNVIVTSLVAFSAILTGVSIIYPPLWFLVFVAPIPFLYTLLSHTFVPNASHAIRLGILYGAVFNGVTALSTWSALPLDWIGINNPFFAVLILGAFWISSSVSMGAAFTFFAAGVFEIRDRGWHILVTIAAIGFLWVGAEWLEAVFSSVFMLSSVSTLNAYFTLSSIGYALANAPGIFLIALARWGGVPLLSLFLAMFSTSIAYALTSRAQPRKHLVHIVLIITFFVLGSASAAYVAENTRGISNSWNSLEQLTVVAAQTDFPAELIASRETEARRTDIIFEIARELVSREIRPDILIMPEGVGNRMGTLEYDKLSELLPEGALLIHSAYPRDSAEIQRVQTRAHILGGFTYTTEKQFLMPYGEYPPYHFALPLRLFAPEMYREIVDHRQYTSGTWTSLASAKGVPVGVRVCAEILSPSLFNALAREYNAGLLVHTSSLTIFKGSRISEIEHRVAARIRAVENGLPIVQATNASAGTAFDCRGKELIPFIHAETFRVYSIPRSAVCPVF